MPALTTNQIIALAVAMVITYFVCGIPFGLIIAMKKAGVDIRELGSGNIGTTNVSRMVGASAGALTLLLDALKGLVCTLGARAFFGAYLGVGFAATGMGGSCDWVGALMFLACILGHCFSPYLHFHGGKGIAVGLGGSLACAWPLGCIVLAAFILVAVPTKYVSAGSITAAIGVPVVAMIMYHPTPLATGVLWAIAVIVVWSHRENVRKLLRGEERKFAFHKDKGEDA